MDLNRPFVGYLVAALVMLLGTFSIFVFGALFGIPLLVLCTALAIKSVEDAQAAAAPS